MKEGDEYFCTIGVISIGLSRAIIESVIEPYKLVLTKNLIEGIKKYSLQKYYTKA